MKGQFTAYVFFLIYFCLIAFILIELKKSFYVKKLEIDARTRILIEDREHGSIDVKIPIEPEFYLDVNSTMTVYSLIGISDDPDLNNR